MRRRDADAREPHIEAAREEWKSGNHTAAQSLLARAPNVNPQAQIWGISTGAASFLADHLPRASSGLDFSKVFRGLEDTWFQADLNSGLRAFRRDVSLPYLRLLPPGFSCVTTITIAFLSNQHNVRYVPIDYFKRAGKSKFHFMKDAYRYILQVLRMVMYFNPLKVLMPPALWLIGLGLVKGIVDQFLHPLYFAINTVLIFVTGLIIASLALLADLIVRSRGDT